MSKYAVEQKILALAKESVRGTAEASATKWYPVMKESDFDYKLHLLDDDAIRGIPSEFPKVAGRKRAMGKVKLPLDAQSIGEFFYSLLGGIASAEQQTIVIGASNNKLDFTIGGGELTATIASASYIIGTSSATASTLCKAIKDALFAADATGTYTVTYSRTTKFFTIARSAGTFTLKAATGTNIATGIWATIGFAATDRSAALTYDGTVQVEYVFQHTVTQDITTIQRPSYTFFLQRGLNVLKYNLAVMKKLHISSPNDQLIMADLELIAKSEASGSIGSPVFPTQRYMTFQHADVKVGGSSVTDIKTWTLDIDNGAFALETLNLTQEIDDVLIRGKQKITGGFTIYFTSTTERDKFLAATTTSLRFLIQGATIANSLKWMVDITLPKINYMAYPYDDEDQLLAAKVTWEGVYDSATSKAISVLINNQDVSY